MDGIVLAAGRGERLRPLTGWLPKFMVPLAGVPVAVHVIRRLVQQGCDRVSVVVSSSGAEFITALKGFVPDVDLEFVICDKPGQMEALRRGVQLTESFAVWVAFCDNIFEPSVRIEYDLGKPIFVSVVDPELAKTGRYGVVGVGVPRIAKSNVGTHVQTGLFFLPRAVCLSAGDDLAAIVSSLPGIREHVFEGWWRDIGEWDMWLDTEQLLRKGSPDE